MAVTSQLGQQTDSRRGANWEASSTGGIMGIGPLGLWRVLLCSRGSHADCQSAPKTWLPLVLPQPTKPGSVLCQPTPLTHHLCHPRVDCRVPCDGQRVSAPRSRVCSSGLAQPATQMRRASRRRRDDSPRSVPSADVSRRPTTRTGHAHAFGSWPCGRASSPRPRLHSPSCTPASPTARQPSPTWLDDGQGPLHQRPSHARPRTPRQDRCAR